MCLDIIMLQVLDLVLVCKYIIMLVSILQEVDRAIPYMGAGELPVPAVNTTLECGFEKLSIRNPNSSVTLSIFTRIITDTLDYSGPLKWWPHLGIYEIYLSTT